MMGRAITSERIVAMPKYKPKVKDARLTVRARLSWKEKLNEQLLAAVTEKTPHSLLKPKLVKKNVIEYSGPQGVPLELFLKKPGDAYSFHYIMEQIALLEQELSDAQLPAAYLIDDFHFVFVNESTKEIRFLYLPLLNGAAAMSIPELMCSIARMWNAEQGTDKDLQYASRFVSMVSSQQSPQPGEILNYLSRILKHRTAASAKSGSKSGFLTDKRAEYYEHYNQKGRAASSSGGDELQTDLLDDGGNAGGFGDSSPQTDLLDESGGSRGFDSAAATDLLDESGAFGAGSHSRNGGSGGDWGMETGLLEEDNGQWGPDTDLLDQQSPSFNGGGFSAGGSGADWSQDTGLLEDNANQWQDETGLLEQNDFGQPDGGFDPDYDRETGLLEENDNPARFYAQRPAYLIRRSTNERFVIDKPVYNIGKDGNKVDCVISDNNTISRVHAGIICRGDHYYICDNSSRNFTYRNNERLAPDEEVEIFSGDVLKLSNEEFEFYIS